MELAFSTYDIGLVVVLRVVLEDLGTLLVVECLKKVVYTTLEVFSPFLTVGEPGCVSASRAQRGRHYTYICFARLTSNFLARRNRS
jgi:hypothetical protein